MGGGGVLGAEGAAHDVPTDDITLTISATTVCSGYIIINKDTFYITLFFFLLVIYVLYVCNFLISFYYVIN